MTEIDSQGRINLSRKDALADIAANESVIGKKAGGSGLFFDFPVETDGFMFCIGETPKTTHISVEKGPFGVSFGFYQKRTLINNHPLCYNILNIKLVVLWASTADITQKME